MDTASSRLGVSIVVGSSIRYTRLYATPYSTLLSDFLMMMRASTALLMLMMILMMM